jgi:hypothetical protein
MNSSDKIILDACCGGKMFWFNKNHQNTIYIDKRTAARGHIKYKEAKNHEISPDLIMDFRNLDFPNGKFKLVVFDPPHIIRNGSCGYQCAKYGSLDKNTWQDDLNKGFNECWRVLADYGTLIFKWNEVDVPVSKIMSIIGREPLFGHKSGKQSKTHWLCFMKLPEEERTIC